jgi:TRAP transporter TAXI family solute receptor
MFKKHSNIRLGVMPQTGQPAILALIRDGAAQMGVVANYYGVMVNRGKGLYEGKGRPLRLLLSAFAVEQGLLSAADANIFTANDVRGKKVSAHYTGAPEEDIALRGQLAMRGLSYKDIIPVTVTSYVEGMKAVVERRSDVAHTGMIALPTTQELIATRGARPVPGDNSPEAVKRVAEATPGYLVVTLGKDDESLKWLKDNRNFPEKLILSQFWFYVVTTPEFSNDLAYEFAKTTWLNCRDLAPISPRFYRDLKPENMATKDAVIPYHPGVVRWFKEKGVWTTELEQLEQKLLAESVK